MSRVTFLSRVILLLLFIVFSAQTLADSQLRSSSVWQLENKQVSSVFTINKDDAIQLLEVVKAKQPELILSSNISAQVTTQEGSGNNRYLLDVLAKKIDVYAQADPCLLTNKGILPSAESHFRFKLVYQCKLLNESPQVDFSKLFQLFTTHIHLVKFTYTQSQSQSQSQDQQYPDKKSSQVLTSRKPEFEFPLKIKQQDDSAEVETQFAYSSSTFANYLMLGYEHILIGSDHIAFILALLLLVSGYRNIALLITGFTLGHLLTLSLMTLEVMTPNGLWVEALIGFSIALIACEAMIVQGSSARAIAVFGMVMILALTLVLAINFKQNSAIIISLLGLLVFYSCYLMLTEQQNHRLYWQVSITFLFGLIHGFGFAGVLSEIGVPENDILSALVAFNLGVELGQLSIVIIVSIIARIFVKTLLINKALFGQAYIKFFTQLSSTLLCSLGVYWFVSRTLMMV